VCVEDSTAVSGKQNCGEDGNVSRCFVMMPELRPKSSHVFTQWN
jgi:hypothetical protein